MKKAKRLRRNDAGFTLIELVFAAGVLAVTLSVLFSGLLTLTTAGDLSEGRTRATTTMAGVMDLLRGFGPNVGLVQPMAFVIDNQPMAVSFDFIDASGNALPAPLVTDLSTPLPPLPNPVEVRVTVAWEGYRGRVYTARASTMISR